MPTRIFILSALLLLGAAYVATASKTEKVPPRDSLKHFPLDLDHWKGQDGPPFTPDILAVLGADEYLNRFYQSDKSGYVGLYIGYYQSQRQGDTIHSPLNCLPGSGWEPVSKAYLTIPVSSAMAPITVNRYVVQKGLDRQVVLYWYQSHGRVIANEYRSKLLMIYDAVRLNRTDAALVRVITPTPESNSDSDAAADARAVVFVKTIFPLLDRYLPS
jgi:EpsI family protein